VKYAEKVRKLADPDSGTKNNDSFDAAMAVMPADRNKRSVWTLASEGYKEAHFATFPTKLVEPCILAGCPEGGEVLDCFGGSGTTGLVADRLGRNAVLCELNPQYAAMADTRVAGDRGHVSRQRGMDLEGSDA
jgi:DNA modification methylase